MNLEPYYCILIQLYDNCIENFCFPHLDSVVVGPHQLYSCYFKPTYQIKVCNDKCEILEEGETSVFLFEPKAFCLLQLQDGDFKLFSVRTRNVHTSFTKTKQKTKQIDRTSRLS